jgi:hypothetical protein
VSVAFVRGRVSFGCCQPDPLIIIITIIVSSISIIIIIMVINDQMFKNGGKSFALRITIAVAKHAWNKIRQFYQIIDHKPGVVQDVRILGSTVTLIYVCDIA